MLNTTQSSTHCPGSVDPKKGADGRKAEPKRAPFLEPSNVTVLDDARDVLYWAVQYPKRDTELVEITTESAPHPFKITADHHLHQRLPYLLIFL